MGIFIDHYQCPLKNLQLLLRFVLALSLICLLLPQVVTPNERSLIFSKVLSSDCWSPVRCFRKRFVEPRRFFSKLFVYVSNQVLITNFRKGTYLLS